VSGTNHDDALIDLVSSIDDEQPVDWVAAEREARSDEDRATIRELRLLSEIARVYRDPDSVVAEPAPPSPSMPLVPSRSWGPLRVQGEIGHGAFSTIYRAIDKLDREVALKVLSLGPEASDEERARILREGRMLAKLRHEHIVSVYGVDEVDGEVGLWMQLVRGTTLEEELAVRGPFSAFEATGIGTDLCHALAAIHGAGLLHRDVKAQNVMREAGGRTVLMDLGAGLDLARDSVARHRPMAGTPLYLAPEIFADGKPSVASDIYSLGVLLFHIVTGKFPVDGKTFDDISRAHERSERLRLRDARADLPEVFVRVVERALEPRPEDRYPSAGELEAALSQEMAKPVPRQSAWWFAAAAIASTALVAAWLIGDRSSRQQPLTVSAGASLPPSPAPAPAVPALQPYTVEAAFLKWTNHEDQRLANDERVRPGDDILLTLRASTPVYVYVYNEDAAGQKYALYPLREEDYGVPLDPGRTHRLPGIVDGEERSWEVSSRGTRENFIVAAGPERNLELEAWLRTLAKPSRSTPVAGLEAPGTLRGVGSMSARAPRPGVTTPSPLVDLRPLGTGPETITGLWARRLTLSNP
jgi:serine/threonine-protein kinase